MVSKMSKKIMIFFFVFLGMTLYASLILYLNSVLGVLIWVNTLIPILLYLKKYRRIFLCLFLMCVLFFIDYIFKNGDLLPIVTIFCVLIDAMLVFAVYGLITAVRRRFKKKKIDMTLDADFTMDVILKILLLPCVVGVALLAVWIVAYFLTHLW